MIITDIRLENIKNIGFFETTFSEGLNTISGPSTSGKSTIIEAIGFVLFDSLSTRKENLVKKGEKRGIIRVGIASGGENYALVRDTKTLYYLFNRKGKYKVYDNKKDILQWVSKEVNLRAQIPLSFLFQQSLLFAEGGLFEALSSQSKTKKNIGKILGLAQYEELPSKIALYKKNLQEKRQSLLRNEEMQKQKVVTWNGKPLFEYGKIEADWLKEEGVKLKLRRIDALLKHIARKIQTLKDKVQRIEGKNKFWEETREKMLFNLSEVEEAQQLIAKNKNSYTIYIDFHKNTLKNSQMLAKREILRQDYSTFKRRIAELVEEEEILEDMCCVFPDEQDKASSSKCIFSNIEKLKASYSEKQIKLEENIPPDVLKTLTSEWEKIRTLLLEAESFEEKYKSNELELSTLFAEDEERITFENEFLEKCEIREGVIKKQDELFSQIKQNTVDGSIDYLESEMLIQLSNIEGFMSATLGVKKALAKISRNGFKNIQELPLTQLFKPSKIQGMLEHQEYINGKLGNIEERFSNSVDFEFLLLLREKLDGEISLLKDKIKACNKEKGEKRALLERSKKELQEEIDKNIVFLEEAKKKIFYKVPSEKVSTYYNLKEKSYLLEKLKKKYLAPVDLGICLENLKAEKNELEKKLLNVLKEGKKLSKDIDNIKNIKRKFPIIKQEYEEYVRAKGKLLRLSKLGLESDALEKVLGKNAEIVANSINRGKILQGRLKALEESRIKVDYHKSPAPENKLEFEAVEKWKAMNLSIIGCGKKDKLLDMLLSFFDDSYSALKRAAVIELGKRADYFFKRFSRTDVGCSVGLSEDFSPYFCYSDKTSESQVSFEAFSYEEKKRVCFCLQLAIFYICGLKTPIFIDNEVLVRNPKITTFMEKEFRGAQVILTDSKNMVNNCQNVVNIYK